MSAGRKLEEAQAKLERAGLLVVVMLVKKKISRAWLQQCARLLRESADELERISDQQS